MAVKSQGKRAGYIETVEKGNLVIGWKHALPRITGFLDAAPRAQSNDRVAAIDLNENTWEDEMKEKLSDGRWW